MDTEKYIDEVMNDDDVVTDLEIAGSIMALVHILIENNLTTADKFCDLRTKYVSIHAKQIRDNVLKKLGKGDEE